MARIAVIGGTGYAGRHIVAEAVEPRPHGRLGRAIRARRAGRAARPTSRGRCSTSPGLARRARGRRRRRLGRRPARRHGRQSASEHRRARRGAAAGVRLGVIGGAGGSLVAEGGARVVDLPYFTEEYKPEALEAIGILEDLAGEARRVRDWFYIHPAGGFGAWNPGERTGSYRDGGDVDRDGRERRVLHLRAPTSRSRSSTRSRTRSTRASASPSATDGRSDQVAPVDPVVLVVARRQSAVMTGSDIVSVGGPMSVASSRRWRSTSSM